MEQKHRTILNKNRTGIIENVANPCDVVEQLYQKKFFTEGMKQEVEAEKTDIGKVRKILDYIPKRGSQAFDGFYSALVATSNGEAADLLKPELKEERLKREAVEGQCRNNRIVGGAGGGGRVHYQRDVLPEVWPDEIAMNIPVQVIPAQVDSHIVSEYWHNEHVYRMTKRRRGKCFVIANKYFQVTDLGDREGTEQDEDRLRRLFEQLFFDVIIHKDKTAEQMSELLQQEARQEAHEHADAFICIILSHGRKEGVCGVDGNTISIEKITEQFDAQHCHYLRHKPKLFFIQACKGEDEDLGGAAGIGIGAGGDIESLGKGVQNLNMKDAQKEEYPPTSSNADLPTKTDTLVASATHPGFVSLRNVLHGSWFIQAIILVFMNYAHKEDIIGLLTLVSNLVARGRAPSSAIQQSDMMQAAMFTSSLRKKFYFFPGIAE